MENKKFKALVIEEKDGVFIRSIQSRNSNDLPEGDLLIQVHYSSLNYKDALSASGNKGVTKKYPHTPGIDAVGVVVQSESKAFNVGDKVIVTGFDLGMNTDGGFGQYIRVPAQWAISVPFGLSMKESMILGTAGITAGLSVQRLTELVKPEAGEIAISGSTGGVGSMSIAILAQLGYNIVAITGKNQEEDYLLNLGARKIISREEFESKDSIPLLSSRFAGGIDCVGGGILENMIKSTKSNGAVACCGNVSSPQLNLTVFPFILRGITLIGIATQNYPPSLRSIIWNNLSTIWKPKNLLSMGTEIGLDGLNGAIDNMLAGRLRGRVVINLLN